MATNKHNLIGMIRKTGKAYDAPAHRLEDVPRLSYILNNAGQWGSSELLSEYYERMNLFIQSEFDLEVTANATDA